MCRNSCTIISLLKLFLSFCSVEVSSVLFEHNNRTSRFSDLFGCASHTARYNTSLISGLRGEIILNSNYSMVVKFMETDNQELVELKYGSFFSNQQFSHSSYGK